MRGFFVILLVIIASQLLFQFLPWLVQRLSLALRYIVRWLA